MLPRQMTDSGCGPRSYSQRCSHAASAQGSSVKGWFSKEEGGVCECGGKGAGCGLCVRVCRSVCVVRRGGGGGFKVGANTPNLRAPRGLCCCIELAVHHTLTAADRHRHTQVRLYVQCDWPLATFGHFALHFALPVNTYVDGKPRSSA